jgi:hypothetical protein
MSGRHPFLGILLPDRKATQPLYRGGSMVALDVKATVTL